MQQIAIMNSLTLQLQLDQIQTFSAPVLLKKRKSSGAHFLNHKWQTLLSCHWLNMHKSVFNWPPPSPFMHMHIHKRQASKSSQLILDYIETKRTIRPLKNACAKNKSFSNDKFVKCFVKMYFKWNLLQKEPSWMQEEKNTPITLKTFKKWGNSLLLAHFIQYRPLMCG